jgi:hypothetical protein
MGRGPVYVVFPTDRPGYLPLSFAYGGPFGGNKVLWVADPAYTGPILIRGRRLDSPGDVRFGETDGPAMELRLVAGDPKAAGPHPSGVAAGWPNWPTATRLAQPGCYAYQIDGTSFSYAIVFAATADER